MKNVMLKLATGAADGAGTVVASTAVLGKLYAIEYQPGTIDTGATLTCTCVGNNAAAKPLLTKASAGTANSWYYPRDLSHKVADGAALTNQLELPILNGLLTAVIASGANSKTGYVIFYYED